MTVKKVALAICGVMLVISGCTENARQAEKAFLSVDFNAQKPLRYKAVSKRTITLDWNPSKKSADATKKYIENAEMVIAYQPVKLDPYGLSTIKAVFEDVTVQKNDSGKKDALTGLKGKSFTFTIAPNGKINDDSGMYELLRKTSKLAFRTGRGKQRIKDPDMLDDAIAIQLQLWDAPAAIEKPAQGLKVGQTWKSILFIPSTMIIRQGLDVTYSLDEIKQTETGQTAVIKSSYLSSDQNPQVPYPYEGQFQLAGTFGFFRSMFNGLSVKDAKGAGQVIYDIDSGRLINSEQNYTATIRPNASPMPGTNPVITIEQKTTIELLDM